MKILYIHQYFRTPQDGGGIRSYYIAKAMVAAGHEVDMISAHNSSKIVIEQIEGIRVIYLPIAYDNKFNFFRRIFAFFGFVYSAIQFLQTHKKNYDLSYVTSTPLTVGCIALWLKKSRQLKYIFEVRDLWPEAPIQVGAIRNKLNKMLLYRLEKTIYRHAEKIVALSPSMRNYIEKKIKGKEVHLISNISDCKFFQMMERKPLENKLKFGIDNEFVVSYFGAAGKVNKLEYLLDAAEESQKRAMSIKFLIMAEGGELPKLKKEAEKKNLTNVQFVDFGSKYDLKDLLSITDAAYISFARFKVLETNSPNKFFDAIAAGKLVIVNTKGWIKDLVENERFGFYADSLSPEQFCDKIKYFIDNPDLLLKYQHKARALAESFFERQNQVDKVLKVIDPHFKKGTSDIFGISA